MLKFLFLILSCLLEAKTIQVGSKAFTESIILGEMATQIAEQQGFSAKHHAGLGGSAVLWNALARKELDIYLEYTGTLIEEFKATPEILEARGFRISKPLGFNNTYALGVRRETAKKFNLQKISDLANYPALIFGMSPEFLDRKEGWRKIQKVYALPQTKISAIEHEVAYRALATQKIDLTDLYATDAEIAEYQLMTLQDDKKVFPAYEAVFLYRKDLEMEAPQFLDTLRILENKISDSEMIQMNLEAKVQKKSEGEIAQSFLTQLNIVSKNETTSFWNQLWKDTLSHLFLVCISLGFAILVAIPLGVLARFYPKFSEVIIGLCSVIQTIPSLALLVFMIPFLGIGKLPAMVALFLYALLPILRNTYMGLIQIPASLLDSAKGLGLPTSYRLFKIELPLALRSILAGIKTSAVITVGTATLGAIIGAGGYGETILMGVRRDDTFLILRGAIPAAIMAMCVQYFFERIEKKMAK